MCDTCVPVWYRGADLHDTCVPHVVQVVLTWRSLSQAMSRRQATIERAVRMYQHRVLTVTAVAVLREWGRLAERSQAQRRSAAHVMLAAWERLWLTRTLVAWSR